VAAPAAESVAQGRQANCETIKFRGKRVRPKAGGLFAFPPWTNDWHQTRICPRDGVGPSLVQLWP
jgi:hypothetical protein